MLSRVENGVSDHVTPAIPTLPQAEDVSLLASPQCPSAEIINFRPGQTQQPASSTPGLHQLIAHCRLFGIGAEPDKRGEIPSEACAVIVSNAVKFAGGRKLAHKVMELRPGYDAHVLDAQIDTAAVTTNTPALCDAVRNCGTKICPEGRNCLNSNGVAVKSPAQLVAWDGATEKNKVTPHRYWAQAFIDRYYPEGFVFAQDRFWGYDRGAFRPLDVRVDIHLALLNLVHNLATDHFVASLAKLLKTYGAQPGNYFDALSATHICLDNGTLDLNSCELKPHSPAHRLQTRLNNYWNPTAECPKWLRFLDEIFANDADKAQKIRFLRQWIGYLVTPDISQHVMTWLVGEGSNGKSVLLDVIRALIGEHNITAVALSDLSNKFSRAHTAGKTLNICSDLPAKAVADGYIKAMVAGEAVEARGFDQDAKTFKTTVRFMAAMNTLPKTADITDGYFRRIVILSFNRQFRGAEVNPHLVQELIEELPGILVWAIEGLRDLRAERRFSVPPSSFEAIDQYRTEADPVRQFAEQCLRPTTDNSGYEGTALRLVFMRWARENGIRGEAFNPTCFGRALRRIGFDKRHSGRDLWLVEPLESAVALFASANVSADEAEDQGEMATT